MTGERRQVLLEVLRIADIRDDVVEPADHAAALAGQVEPGAGHDRGEPDRLQRDGLAASVRARDQQGLACGDGDIVRDAAPLAEQHQRMPGVQERDPGHLVEDRLGRDRVVGHDRGRRDHVELLADRGRAREAVRFLGDPAGELDEDPALLGEHLGFGELQPVVELDDLFGLDEHGLAALRRAVDDALDEPLTVGAHGQHVAILALRVVLVLEIGGEPLVDEQRRHPLLERILDRRGGLAERSEIIARVIDEAAVRIECVEDRMEHVAEIRELRAVRREPRRVGGVSAQVDAQPLERPAGRRDRDELCRLECGRLPHAIDRARDIGDVGERQALVERRERARFGDLGRARPSRVDRGQQDLAAHGGFTAPRGAALRPVVDQGRPAEVVESPLPDHEPMLSRRSASRESDRPA